MLFFENINKQDLFIYIIITISILFFFTNVVQINSGHILAFFFTITLLIYLINNNNQNIIDHNTLLDYKLNSLLDNEPHPDYFYIDSDLINTFFEIKNNLILKNYDNYNVYKSAVICANNLLKIKNDFDKQLCGQPIVPNIHKNFTPFTPNVNTDENFFTADFLNVNDYDIKDNPNCETILINAYENYEVAVENLQKCINYIQSLIITIPSNPVIHRTHSKLLEKTHILLKRNLDHIKLKYNDSLKKSKLFSSTKFISDYDLPKPYQGNYNNKHFTFF